MAANTSLMEKKQIRERVKERLKKLDYKEAIEIAMQYCDNEEDKDKLKQNLAKLNKLYSDLKEKKISNEKFYYGINDIVSEVLEVLDNIVGETDDNWESIDELTSSLKFNLVNQSEDLYSSQDVVFAFNVDGKIVFDFEDEELANDPKVVRMKKLYQQMNYYEEKMKKATDEEEKAKYRSIIKAIEQRIAEEGEEMGNH